MPSPRPIKRQFARSAGVPCARRGYQSNGTLTVRPSTRSTTSASSVTVTRWASAARNSLCEVLIPRPTELNCVVPHQRLHAPDLGPAKTAALRQPQRVEPEFRTVRFPLHMHVPWFDSVSGVEEQPIWPCPEDRRHRDDCMPMSRARGLAVSLTISLLNCVPRRTERLAASEHGRRGITGAAKVLCEWPVAIAGTHLEPGYADRKYAPDIARAAVGRLARSHPAPAAP